jgi:tetraacyldisaccharide 4'-kinase
MSAGQALQTPFALLYGGAIRIRNAYYDRWPGAVHRASVPVISIGNLSVGGTGKTPLVIEVVRRLQSWGRRPAILTRGYKGGRDVAADEVLELREAVPGVPVVVHPDRVAGARIACAAESADCLVLDDGFQHRRLARDLDVVLISALGPLGVGWLLPVGRLREPLSSLRRADVLVITRSNQVTDAWLDAIRTTLRKCCPDTPLVYAAVEAVAPPDLAGRRVVAVCGIGEPCTFTQLLVQLTGQEPAECTFGDHHRYDSADVRTICEAAQREKAEWVVTTRKDWVKLRDLWPAAAVPLLRIDVKTVITAGSATLDSHLRQALEHTP